MQCCQRSPALAYPVPSRSVNPAFPIIPTLLAFHRCNREFNIHSAVGCIYTLAFMMCFSLLTDPSRSERRAVGWGGVGGPAGGIQHSVLRRPAAFKGVILVFRLAGCCDAIFSKLTVAYFPCAICIRILAGAGWSRAGPPLAGRAARLYGKRLAAGGRPQGERFCLLPVPTCM